MSNPDKENIIDFRLSKLEEAVTQLINNLTTLKDIMARWDARIGDGNKLLQCDLHQERMTNLINRMNKIESDVDIRTTKVETEVDNLKSIIWKASGALIVLSVIVQLFGPFVMDRVFGSNNSKSQVVELIEK